MAKNINKQFLKEAREILCKKGVKNYKIINYIEAAYLLGGALRMSMPDAVVYVKFKVNELKKTLKEENKFLKITSNQKIKIKYTENDFLQTYEWRKLRLEALLLHGTTCQCCGASKKTGAVLNVDHIKPRKYYPELSLNLDNLQVLCSECNHGKGNWNQTDFR